MNSDVIAFLQESNYIEGVIDGLDQAVKAWKYIITKKELTRAVILKTHAILMRGKLDHKEAGAWRKVPVWIGGREGRPWYAIPDSMDGWIEGANLSIGLMISIFGSEDETIEAIKGDHIVFESIHPFIDGNGRTGRILLNWQRLKAGLPILIIKEEEKQEYYRWFK